MMGEIEKSVQKCLGFFSYFTYAPTAFEVYRFHEGGYEYIKIVKALDRLVDAEIITMCDGYYVYGDAELAQKHVKIRQERYLDAMKKRNKLFWYLPFIKRLPAVRGVALCNFLPLHFTRPESDIDLFILTDNGKIWGTRFFLSFVLRFLRQRPGESKIHAIDTSFLVSEEGEDLSNIKIDGEDPYLKFWIRALLPIYEREEGVFDGFFAKNSWVSMNISPLYVGNRVIKIPFFHMSERFAERIQRKLFSKSINDRMNKNTDIIVSDCMLKFHQNDRRIEIADYVERFTLNK